MNENLKHSLLNLYLYIAAVVLSFLSIHTQNLLVVTIVIASSVIIYFLLSLTFFGPKEIFSTSFRFIKQNLLNIFAIMIVVGFSYMLIINPIVSDLELRVILFIGFLTSWTVLSLKVRNFSNLGLIKTFFKENLILMDGWLAAETNDEQQTDYREISLHGKPLKKLVFTIRPASPFWRAGFKLTDPNGTILPLRTNNSLIFHLGSTGSEDRFGITAYINGEWVESLIKTLPFNREDPIRIGVEVNQNNFIQCYVNGQVEFEPIERIDPRILKKAFLAAWGDGHNMRVEFDSIGFTAR